MILKKAASTILNEAKALRKPAQQSIKSRNVLIEGNQNKIRKSGTQKKTSFVTRFIAYIDSKLIKIQKADIKRISKLPAEQFLIETQKLIAKSKGYNPEFMAPFVLQPLGSKKISMLYIPSANQIVVNTDKKLKPGAKLFSDLCHEYEHMHQNIQVMRTPLLREKAVNTYAKNQAQFGVDNFIQMYKDVKKEQLPSLKEALGDSYAYVESFINSRDAGKEVLDGWRLQAIKLDENVIKQQWENIKNKIVAHYGEIKEGSKEAEKAKDYFKCFTSDASPTGFKKNTTINEIEAYLTSTVNLYNYLFNKLI